MSRSLVTPRPWWVDASGIRKSSDVFNAEVIENTIVSFSFAEPQLTGPQGLLRAEYTMEGCSSRADKDEIPSQDASYVLATGASAVDRLQLLDQIFGPASRVLLSNAGLSSASSVAEIGCGTGLLTLWIAAQVSPGVMVHAVDLSEQQIAVASKNAKAAGRQNISYHVASAKQTGLPHGFFDLVHSRFLMCHLTEPIAALAEMWNLLAPGGTLVCEDFEMSAVASCPPTAAYQRLINVSRAVDRQCGVDSDIGAKLHSLFLEAGCGQPEVAVYQPAFLRGRAKEFWRITLQEAKSAIVDRSVATPEEVDCLCDELGRIAKDDSIVVLVARVYQVWCRKDLDRRG
jgi:ubiquinone/menaquinone biosynthesis C-methylase UbiE